MSDEREINLRRSKRVALADVTNVSQPGTEAGGVAGQKIVKRRKLDHVPTTTTNSQQDMLDTSSSSLLDESALIGSQLDILQDSSISINTSAVSIASDHVEKEKECYGFVHPPKIARKFPIMTKSADPAQCCEVLDDIYAFYRATQTDSMPNFNYENSKEITIRMRTILVDWLIEVHYKYKLFPATLWLTVNLLDRYLEHTKVLRNNLQLVGITAMLVACKFEEFRAPSVQDFVSLTDKAYTQQQILDMEFSVLNALNYSLLVPTSHHFMQRYLQRIHATERVRLLTYYLAERTLQEKDIFDYTPQVYAAAAVYAALRATNFESGVVDEVWCSRLIEETGLDVAGVSPCARVLLYNATQVPVSSTRRKLEAVRKKYNTKSTQFVSEILLPTVEEFDRNE